MESKHISLLLGGIKPPPRLLQETERKTPTHLSDSHSSVTARENHLYSLRNLPLNSTEQARQDGAALTQSSRKHRGEEGWEHVRTNRARLVK